VRGQAEPFTFALGDTAALVARLEAVEGRVWVNVQPHVDDEDLPAEGGTPGLLSGRGPTLPLATWTPGQPAARRPTPVTIGIQHGAGPRVAHHLRDLGLPVPPAWEVVQDHPRRGLVVEVPDGSPLADVLGWLLAATGALCPVPFVWWHATLHRPR